MTDHNLTAEQESARVADLDLQHACDRLVRNEVHLCLSALVATLAGACDVIDYGMSMCAMIGLRTSESQAARALAEQAYELAASIDDYEEAAQQAGWERDPGGAAGGDNWRRAVYVHVDSEWEYAVGAQDACYGSGIDPYQRKVCEHWAVTDWLAEKLEAQGEKVDRDFAGLVVWARTTTGQAISMDGCIRAIARKMMETMP